MQASGRAQQTTRTAGNPRAGIEGLVVVGPMFQAFISMLLICAPLALPWPARAALRPVAGHDATARSQEMRKIFRRHE